MEPLHVPLAAAAVLLVASGPGKLRAPAGAQRALRQVGLPAPAAAVRSLGLVEVAAGAGVLVAGDRPALPLALALLYGGFAAFVLLALWRGAPLTSCGCFGAAGVTPTPLHAGVDAGLAAVGAIAALDPIPSALDVLRGGGGDAAVLVASTALTAAAGYGLFTGRRIR